MHGMGKIGLPLTHAGTDSALSAMFVSGFSVYISYTFRVRLSRSQKQRNGNRMRLVIGSDHAGWPIKQAVIDHIHSQGSIVVSSDRASPVVVAGSDQGPAGMGLAFDIGGGGIVLR